MRLIALAPLLVTLSVSGQVLAQDAAPDAAPPPPAPPPDGPEPWPTPGDDTPAPEPEPEPRPPAVATEPPPPPPPPPPAPPVRFTTAVPPSVSAEVKEDVDDPVPNSTHLMTRVAGGGTARYVFGTLMVGGEGELGIGVDSPFGSFSLAASFFGGTTAGSFTTLHGVMGFYAAWPIGVLRLGFQPRIGYIDIERVTTLRQFGAYTAGIAAVVSVDLVREDGYAFALGARPVLDALIPLNSDGIGRESPAALFGGNAFLELRWRSAE